MVHRCIGLMAALCVLAVGACSDSQNKDAINEPAAAVAPASSFGQIQRRIFDQKCVSCHTTGGSALPQSGLRLGTAESYQNLVGAAPVNDNAKADGFVRVMPGNPNISLLYHKLAWSPEHHAGRSYGSPMPLGGEPITTGQLEFIRKWIAVGAPREGYVADSTLLIDMRPQYVEDFKPLPLPASGYQLHIDSFAVAPNFERELFLYKRVGNTQDVYVNRVETRMRLNSHHLLLLSFKDSTPPDRYPQYDVIRDIRAPNGDMLYQNMLVMGWQQFFAGANTPYEDKQLPAGVALKLPANASLDLNSHYINGLVRPIPGEVYINLHTIPVSQVQKVARPLTLQHDTFALPPLQRTTVTRTFLFDKTVNILMLTSHNHEMGERFEIRIAGGPRNGELIYTSTDWKHPVILWLAQPLVLEAGQGLTSIVTFNNTTTRTLRHGFLSTDEMDIMRGYYY
jgi:hypothetical protein